jgi:hypothetical protein
MQLNLVNPANNVWADPRANIALSTLKKIQKYNFNKYTAYLFIILNYADSSELISKNNVPIFQLLKICGYMHIICAICVRTIRDSIKELKRLIDNVLLYRYLTYNVLE